MNGETREGITEGTYVSVISSVNVHAPLPHWVSLTKHNTFDNKIIKDFKTAIAEHLVKCRIFLRASITAIYLLKATSQRESLTYGSASPFLCQLSQAH